MVRASISWHLSIYKVEGSNPGASFLFRVEILKKKGSLGRELAHAQTNYIVCACLVTRFSVFERSRRPRRVGDDVCNTCGIVYVRIRMRRPNKIAIQSSYMHERDAWL